MSMAYNAATMDSVLPKYHMVKLDLENRIHTQEFKIGDMLPSESMLMKRYGVSRITVRKALEDLVQEGTIYRIQGKGTFVQDTSQSKEGKYRNCVSCSDLLRSFNLKPTRRVISREIIPCPEDVAERLRIKPGRQVLLYERIYYGDDDPAIYGKSYISLEHLPGFEQYDLAESSMMRVIEEDYHQQVYKFDRKLRAVSATNEIAKKLQVLTGFPLLYLTFVSKFSGTDIPFEDACLCYRTDVIDYLPDNY